MIKEVNEMYIIILINRLLPQLRFDNKKQTKKKNNNTKIAGRPEIAQRLKIEVIPLWCQDLAPHHSS